MISLTGNIAVRTIYGRNGPFNVGTLVTDIGEFSIKDPSIEELSEGVYDARCAISQIKPSSYISGNRVVMEIRAFLEDLDLLQDTPEKAQSEPDPEPDPIDIPEPVTVNTTEAASKDAEEEKTNPVSKEPEDSLEGLFGHIWPLGTEVRLDYTVDRETLRCQVAHLRNEGYTFIASERVWTK